MKKISLTLFAVCFLLLGRAQDLKFTVIGKTEIIPYDHKMLFVRYDLPNGQRFDTISVDKNGNFTFAATVPEAEIGMTVWNEDEGQGSAVFYLEAGKINVDIKKGKKFPMLSGTPLNNDFNDYYLAMEKMLDSANAADRPSIPYEWYMSSEAVKKVKLDMMQKFVPTHKNSLMALFKLKDDVGIYYDELTDLTKLYHQFTPKIQNSVLGKEMALRITGFGVSKVGDVGLDFALPDVNGKIVKLSDFKGKYVLLDFWATWCVPCVAEIPNVAAAYKKYNGKNFDILGISLDRPDSKEKWLKMIKEKQMDWVQLSDLKWWNSDAALLYAVQGVPANFLIDPDGRIIAKNLMGDDLQKKLAEVFSSK